MRGGGHRVAHLREDGGEEGVVRVVGSCDPREGLGGFGVFLGAIEGAPEMAPEALRVVRIEAHRLPDPVDAFFRPSEPGQKLALLDHDEIVVGVERERPLLMVGGLVMIVAHQVQRREDAVHVAVIVVERQRSSDLRDHLLHGAVAIRAPPVDPGLAEHARLPGVGVRVVRIERDRAIEQALRLGVVLADRAVVQHLGGQHAFIGRHVVGRLALRAVVRGGLDAAGKRRDDRAGHLVLDGEDILKLAVVAFGPDMPVGFRIDQLHGDADAIADLAHAALEHVFDAEFACDLAARSPACPCARRSSCAR